MKRVAICLSGQPRSYLAGFRYLHENLIKINQRQFAFDFFIHTWESNLQREYIEFINPISYIVEPEMKRIGTISDPYSFDSRYSRLPVLVECYGSLQSDSLRRRHEFLYNFKYHFVIKTRTDFALNIAIDLQALDPTKIYVPDINTVVSGSSGVLHANFGVGNSMHMSVFSSYIYNLDFDDDPDVIPASESLLYKHLYTSNLLNNVVLFKYPLPFPAGLYNSTPHSLIRDDMERWLKR